MLKFEPKVFFIVACFLLCLSFGYREYNKYVLLNDGLMHVYFLNIGQGDGFLIKTPDCRLVIIDGGPDEAVLLRLGKILPFWIKKVDLSIISHFHRDHYMGVYYISKYFEVENILYGDLYERNEELNLLFAGFTPDGKNRFKHLSGGEDIFKETYGSMKVRVWSPAISNRPINENYETNLALFSYGNFDVLFTGDAPPSLQKAAQADLKDKRVEILKVPHQGSKYDLYPPLIDQIRPDIGIISVGFNAYGHPHSDVVKYYENAGIRLARTDEVVDFILVKTDGNGYEVSYH